MQGYKSPLWVFMGSINLHCGDINILLLLPDTVTWKNVEGELFSYLSGVGPNGCDGDECKCDKLYGTGEIMYVLYHYQHISL